MRWIFLIMLVALSAAGSEVVGSRTGKCFDYDSKGFITLLPDKTDCHKRLLRDGKIILDSAFTTDPYGRRNVPQSESSNRDQFIAFMGCSFTFGEGVSDSDTYPAQIALRHPRWKIYDYGQPGWGPNNVLESLSSRDLAKEIPEHRGKFVYLWIPDHAIRAVGALSHDFSDEAPHYVLDSRGRPVLRSSFKRDQPIRYWLYGWLRRWDLGEKLGFDIPPRISDADLDLSVALIREIKRVTERDHPESEFYLALWPDRGPLADRARAKFKHEFADGSIRILDYSGLAMTAEDLLPDGHPSPRGYRRFAEQIGHDLGL